MDLSLIGLAFVAKNVIYNPFVSMGRTNSFATHFAKPERFNGLRSARLLKAEIMSQKGKHKVLVQE